MRVLWQFPYEQAVLLLLYSQIFLCFGINMLYLCTRKFNILSLRRHVRAFWKLCRALVLQHFAVLFCVSSILKNYVRSMLREKTKFVIFQSVLRLVYAVFQVLQTKTSISLWALCFCVCRFRASADHSEKTDSANYAKSLVSTLQMIPF